MSHTQQLPSYLETGPRCVEFFKFGEACEVSKSPLWDRVICMRNRIIDLYDGCQLLNSLHSEVVVFCTATTRWKWIIFWLLTGNIKELKTIQSLPHHPDRRGQSLQANVWQAVTTDEKLNQAAEEERQKCQWYVFFLNPPHHDLFKDWGIRHYLANEPDVRCRKSSWSSPSLQPNRSRDFKLWNVFISSILSCRSGNLQKWKAWDVAVCGKGNWGDLDML